MEDPEERAKWAAMSFLLEEDPNDVRMDERKVTKAAKGIIPPFDSSHQRQQMIFAGNGREFECLLWPLQTNQERPSFLVWGRR